MNLSRLIIFFFFLLPISASAAVYECYVNGKTVYTNKSRSGCRSASLASIGSYSSDHRAYANANRNNRYTTPSRSSNRSSSSSARSSEERVSSSVQKTRDSGRLSILQRELSNEQNALNHAQSELKQNKTIKTGENPNEYKNRLRALEGAIKDRQENINAIQKEISRI